MKRDARLEEIVIRRVFILAVLLTIAPGHSTARAAEPLRLGVVPYEAEDKVRENFKPFLDYLSRRIGRQVTVYVATDYVGLTEALRAKKIELYMSSPFPYVMASSQVELVPLFAWLEMKEKGKRGDLYYRGVIITRNDSGIKRVEDLKGKRMAFMDPASTSGHLYPVELLMRHGVHPKKDLKMQYYAGNADALVNAVYNGNVDAGALYRGGMERVLKDPEKIKQMRVVAETRDIPTGVLAARGDLPKSLIEKIRRVIAELDRGGQCEAICGSFSVNGWVPVKDEQFDSVRKVAKILKVDLKKK